MTDTAIMTVGCILLGLTVLLHAHMIHQLNSETGSNTDVIDDILVAILNKED